MIKRWQFEVALRLLGGQSGSRLLSFIGLLSIGGLTLAVAVLVTVLSVVNGFDRELRERVLGVVSHGTLYARDDSVTDWDAIRAMSLAHPQVLGVAPVVEGSGLLVANGELLGVSFKGVDTELEPTVSILPGFMVSGSFDDLAATRYGVLLGAELAGKLQVVRGDRVSLVLPRVSFGLAGPVLTTRQLEVAGVFRVGADIDGQQVLLNLEDARKLKRQRHIDGLVLRMKDLFDAPEVLQQLMLAMNDQALYGVSWMRQSGSLYEAIRTQKTTLFLLLMILVAVAAFNVVSNLVMTVDDNRGEVAILRTMGASPADIRRVFVVHGMLVGTIGLMLGILAGLALTVSLGRLFAFFNDAFSLNLMSEYFIRYLPIEILASDITLIVLITLGICMLATLYPASRAANANPAEALQYEV
ncbi:MAG: lipoprotein-releasing ABC transporter permease subunit [Proteobacteria bacterium]|nr:lipoprotein-releasing ABC transporter permease subunit [Pseudomonadota bacterium]